MKLLITGGLGFIGSNFIRRHLQRFPEDRILNFDKMTYAGNPANLIDVAPNPHYQFLKAISQTLTR
jgi:dTDP-glucose 4,6-dehydratase